MSIVFLEDMLELIVHFSPHTLCKSCRQNNHRELLPVWKNCIQMPCSTAAVDLTGKAILRQLRIIYSVRSAFIGSIDAARRAGTKQAARATSMSRTQTAAITVGSIGLTLKSN